MTSTCEYIPATTADPCRHCGATKRCSRTADGSKEFCYKEAKGYLYAKVDCQGVAYWIHRGPNFVEFVDEPLPNPTDEIVDVDNRDRVYSMLLDMCRPSPEDRAALKARGLDDYEINGRRYGTLPEKPHNIARKLRSKFDDAVLVQTPGFIVKNGLEPGTTYLSINAAPGLLIPSRNPQGQIFALKIRPKKDSGGGKYRYLSSAKFGGPKADMGPHVPLNRKSTKPITSPIEIVRVTEGELKADIATALNCQPTISIPGIGNWRAVTPVIQGLGAQTVLFSPDADALTNPDVAYHSLKCHAGLIAAGFIVILETWPIDQGKGIDDLLAAGGTPERLEGDAAAEFLEKLRAVAATRKAADEPEADSDKPVTIQEAVDDPHRLAREFLASKCTNEFSQQTLVFYRDEFHQHNGILYRPVPTPEIRARLIAFIKIQFDAENLYLLQNPKDEEEDPPKCRKVTTTVVTNTLAALQSVTLLEGHHQTPLWLGDSPGIEPADIMATRSGLLVFSRLGNGDCLHKPTAQFFSPNGVDYDYDPDASCPSWLRFLDSLWPDDLETIHTLQDWFGYLLLPDASLHKLLMLIGPPRSGKGTIARVIKRLIGENNLACPKLASFAGPFGLQPLLGKTAALITDARLSGRADAIAIVENLLSISGEDPQDVARKNMPTLTGIRLPVRFTIMTNELPNMRDASGALTSRVILLRMTRSFLGKEDKTLDGKLAAELSGILNWSLIGWDGVRNRGSLIQPESGRELLADLDDLASPISQFIRECCHVGPEFSIRTDEAWRAWRVWCARHGRENVGTQETFGKDLRASLPQVKRVQARCDDERIRVYEGIDLRLDFSVTG